MNLSLLTAISPVDGRYRTKTEAYAAYFSEYALMRYRILVEVEYFIALCEIPLKQLAQVPTSVYPKLRAIYANFSEADALKIKEIESVTNHDVKAIEYFVKEKFDSLGLQAFKEFIHFGLTSQDINNTAVPLSIKNALDNVYFPEMEEVLKALTHMVDEWRDVSMLAKTHGQPASPTRLGKEMMVFVNRLNQQLAVLKQTPNSAKFGGATGNYNAHAVAFPSIDWKNFGNKFVSEKLGLDREQWTTQISNYDNLAAQFDALKRINTILIDFCRDIWTYVAEGNLAIANASFEFLAGKLPVSRLQRDLTDSTVLRNVGVPFAHTLIATQSILKGLSKLLLNETAIYRDLDNTWAVVAEGIQTILRREAYPSPYEALKALTRTNEGINEKSICDFIETLEVSQSVKEELKRITPRNYTGV